MDQNRTNGAGQIRSDQIRKYHNIIERNGTEENRSEQNKIHYKRREQKTTARFRRTPKDKRIDGE